MVQPNTEEDTKMLNLASDVYLGMTRAVGVQTTYACVLVGGEREEGEAKFSVQNIILKKSSWPLLFQNFPYLSVDEHSFC